MLLIISIQVNQYPSSLIIKRENLVIVIQQERMMNKSKEEEIIFIMKISLMRGENLGKEKED